uniref:Uncharacterized protein n=1 Tax=Rhizophora mucronata TaxID=61149 RepID=A0A2P2KNJ4_RHIMU
MLPRIFAFGSQDLIFLSHVLCFNVLAVLLLIRTV